MNKRHGFDLLADQIAEWLSAEWDYTKDEKGSLTGDTPIEKLLFQAIKMSSLIGATEFCEILVIDDETKLGASGEPHGLTLYVWPQAPIKHRRVDFLIYAPDYKTEPRTALIKWRKLIIECDGHEFHERTKAQASKDRSKDRDAILSGDDFFRFTGSEIWRDPMECARQVFDWAAKGVF